MLEKLTFKNHLNQSLDFGKNGLFAEPHDLRDYEWEYTVENNRIADFTRGVTPKSLPILIACRNQAEGIALKNRLCDFAEIDIRDKSPGKIIIGNYYLSCYIVGSKKTEYVYHKGYMRVTLAVVTERPFWVQETNYTFSPNTNLQGYNLPHDYPFDYISSLSLREIVNTSLSDCDFQLIIHGQAVNPSITIGGHVYQINATIPRNEYLIIDSSKKTIFLHRNQGVTVNCFANRLKSSYIFQKLPSGKSAVSWNGNFIFSLTLFSERSEPLWT